ncbi:oxidoreductase [Paenibacillus abyssi]|uniref:Nucleoside-diphosphate sugar epimerase n=1 Tax=Paenibacillus abyssi TaxID=1340531 RepID=A0A917CGE3_9BACL|nr:oxidoreductase [Paenibacillus abyssi]GGF86721.1 nucleoside-diphosphate sugar epimerase [Paenibacillus abyssi]
MGKVAVVAGAAGLVGKELVQLLLQHPDYERVIALVRRKSGAEQGKLIELVVSFDRLEQEASGLMKGADVFCALGTTIKKAKSQEQFRRVDYVYPLQLGELGKREGVRSYSVITAMGANEQSRFFYSRVKGELETRLAALGLNTLHIFRPSLLLGDREEFRLGERIGGAAAKPLSFLLNGPLRKYRAIEATTVAEAMVAAVQRESNPGVHIYESDRIEQIAKSFAK